MMKIAIMRHGEAEQLAASDRERPLTDFGFSSCRQVSDYLTSHFNGDNAIKTIYHSPYLRTTQTAQQVGSGMQAAVDTDICFRPSDALLGGNKVEDVVDWMQSANCSNCLLVTHQPLVSRLLAWLIDGAEQNAYGQYPMQPASVAVLEFDIVARGCMNLLDLSHVER